jgi:hypothetical protein
MRKKNTVSAELRQREQEFKEQFHKQQVEASRREMAAQKRLDKLQVDEVKLLERINALDKRTKDLQIKDDLEKGL